MSQSPHPDDPERGPEQPGNPYFPQQQGGAAGPYGPYGLSPTGVPWGPPPDHPRATTVLILGVLSFALCQAIAPFAWVIGGRTLREIDASGGRWGGRSQVKVGYVLGIVGSVLLALGVLLGVVYLVVLVAAVSTSA
ncbi:hypothetical protein [Nocardioides rubriscoriae]|uniref:hypothetical protein n=1 Tax=Nocardioides rubriscoriae TaxID=642762 RepID=UPI001B87A90B|nr:hypothetical protein [Nocardioides rubriscoriae]